MLSRWARAIVPLFAAVLLTAGNGMAQDKNQALLNRLQDELDQVSKDVAEEYLDILETLRDVLDDYGDYMREMPTDARDHQMEAVDRLRQNLSRDSYSDNPEKLLDDIYEAIDGIKTIENEHRVKFNTNNPKCCRLGRSLRKELVIVAELVEDYTNKQTTAVLQKDDIKKYVSEALRALAELERAKTEHGRKSEEVRRLIEALGLDGRAVVVPGEAPEVDIPEPPETPMAPRAPKVPEAPIVIFSPRSDKSPGRRGARHMSQGQVSATNSTWPIAIEHPSGDIIVTGTADKTISATLILEVASTSHAKEKEYLDRALLAVGQGSGKYTVSVDLPRLSDHRTELLGSTLEVSVPRSNKIDCSNAFGQVRIADINARVTVDGDKSTVEIERVSGGTVVRNSMGSVALTEVSGDIDVETSYAPITMTRCRGAIVLENRYSPIRISGCRGNAEINNTGQIEIDEHEGNLIIENAYGRVAIDRVRGNVYAKNGYQALVVTDISGSAELVNMYAEVSAESIGGSLSITNNNGQIFAERLAGPVELSNYYGNTSISLGRVFKGGSTITSTGGAIKVAFVESPNLVLTLHTTGGTISSSLPLSVRTRGDLKSAELVLGDGGETLDISGTGSAIVIQGR